VFGPLPKDLDGQDPEVRPARPGQAAGRLAGPLIERVAGNLHHRRRLLSRVVESAGPLQSRQHSPLLHLDRGLHLYGDSGLAFGRSWFRFICFLVNQLFSIGIIISWSLTGILAYAYLAGIPGRLRRNGAAGLFLFRRRRR
jgi:hypothetical protein